jgi:hypothetical protein
MCQRYYWKTFDGATGTAPGDSGAVYSGTNTNTSTSFDMRVVVRNPVMMRSAPTVTLANPTQTWGNTNWRTSSDSGDVASVAGNINTQGFVAALTAVPAQQWARGHLQASAEL